MRSCIKVPAKKPRSWAVTLIKTSAGSRRLTPRRPSLLRSKRSRSMSGSASGCWCGDGFRVPSADRADQVAAFVHSWRIPLRAVAVELLFPFYHVGIAPVFFDQIADAVTAPALAAPAFDAQHVELAFNVAKYEIGAGLCWSFRAGLKNVSFHQLRTYRRASLCERCAMYGRRPRCKGKESDLFAKR